VNSSESYPKPGTREESVRRFLHDLAAPLSAVALHLETAMRKVKQDKDPMESLQTAQRELEKAFEMFDRGRMEIMGSSESLNTAR
jgi:hypothetical protein